MTLKRQNYPEGMTQEDWDFVDDVEPGKPEPEWEIVYGEEDDGFKRDATKWSELNVFGKDGEPCKTQ